jgi:HAD superfamily hydrolase (TIGR01509 family)
MNRHLTPSNSSPPENCAAAGCSTIVMSRLPGRDVHETRTRSLASATYRPTITISLADPNIMKLPHTPAAVVFDMDGLLFDTEALYQEASVVAATEGGHDVTSGILNRTIGLPWPQTRSLLIDHFGDTFPADEFISAWVRHFDLMASTRLSLKPGATELLDALDDLRLPRAIATSSSHQTVQHHLTAHNLAGRFHEIVGHGDYASGKPAPDPFLKAAERLGVEPRLCLALEDSHNGVRSASSAGMITIMVPDLLEPTDEIRGLCTFVARDLHEVRSLILGSVPCR